jgi:hypothetical protein
MVRNKGRCDRLARADCTSRSYAAEPSIATTHALHNTVRSLFPVSILSCAHSFSPGFLLPSIHSVPPFFTSDAGTLISSHLTDITSGNNPTPRLNRSSLNNGSHSSCHTLDIGDSFFFESKMPKRVEMTGTKFSGTNV